MMIIQNSINNVLRGLKMIYSRCGERCFREDQPCIIIERGVARRYGIPFNQTVIASLVNSVCFADCCAPGGLLLSPLGAKFMVKLISVAMHLHNWHNRTLFELTGLFSFVSSTK